MKILIMQMVEIENTQIPLRLEKEINSDIIPNIGMTVEDSLWKDPGEYKVADVVINYQENCCYITVEKYNDSISNDYKEEFKHIAELHGWSCV